MTHGSRSDPHGSGGPTEGNAWYTWPDRWLSRQQWPHSCSRAAIWGRPRETIADPATPLAASDFDGDGRTDFVSVGDGRESRIDAISVLLATSDGGFTVTKYDRPDEHDDVSYRDVALVDADSDGDEDVAVIDEVRRVVASVVVFENVGGGVLGSPQTVMRGVVASRLAVGDVDADGHDDLVLSSGDGLVLLGDGAGGFSFDPETPLQRAFGGVVEIADVDGDGLDDLLVGTQAVSGSAVIEVYRRLTTGWAPPVQYLTDAAMHSPGALVVADVNGDLVLDVVAANVPAPVSGFPPGSVSVLLGLGDGTFGPPVITADIPRVEMRSELGTGDIDGDGLTDVVLAHAGGVRVMFGDGVGGLVDLHVLNPSDGAATDVEVLDVDADGVDDVVTAGTRLDIFRNGLDGARTHD